MNAAYRCWAEVNLDALRENLHWVRHHVGRRVKVLTVVKGDAYGHGLKQIAALLMQSGTDIFGVANLTEAQHIRSVGRGWPILLLGACLPDEVETAVVDEVMPTISSLSEAEAFSRAAVKAGRIVQVHVKVDTGMGRLGVAPGQALELIQQVRSLPSLKLAGLYTHYAAAEDDPEFTMVQRKRFQRLVEQLESRHVHVPLIHANNSAGLLHEPESMFNLVRCGLIVYGVSPPGSRLPPADFNRRLRPALSWKTRVGLVKEVSQGTPLSYGHTFTTPRKMRIATLTVGYADGYLRSGSNRARALIGGRRCPIVGRITMDQMLADVSEVGSLQAGDEAVLIGAWGQEEITASQLADWCGTVPWEILTNITYRVPRLYRGAQAA